MIAMGDEVRRTQRGNNNAYCQDNDTSWFDWTLLSKHADMRRFVTLLIARRFSRDVEPENHSESLNQRLRESNKAWHGVKLFQPDWSGWSHSLAFSAEIEKENYLVHVILNAYWEPLEFELPPVSEDGGGPWRRWVDTFLDTPDDIVAWQAAPEFGARTYVAGPHSVAVLYAPLGLSGKTFR
jgi:glycogen operon protein